MAEVSVLHGSTALWALAPARTGTPLRLVPDPSEATAAGKAVRRPRVGRPGRGSRADRGGAGPVTPSEGGGRTSTLRSAKQPLTLTQRGRLVLIGLPLTLGVAALILFGAFLTSQAQAGESSPESSSVVEVNVAAGETLWDLAVQYAPDRDPRDVVAEIVELNSLRTSLIQAGESISVPLQG
jgi:hypothetical protein